MKKSNRRALFPREYVVDLNATQAAKRSGYSKKTAYSQGQRLLKNVEVLSAIRNLMKKREDKLEITAEKWLRELAIVGFSDLKDYLKINGDTGAIRARGFEEMPGESSRALESITETRTIHEDAKGEQAVVNEKVTFRLHPKIKALEAIGEHLGFLKGNKIDAPGIEKALYELSEKFMPAVHGKTKTRSDEPK